jgi:DNA-binding NtrC family response regulator
MIDQTPTETSARPQSVLIVEDEPLVRASLSDYLQQCGFRVLEASTANEAILLIIQSDVEIDVVFSDVMMPGTLDGLGLAQWIKSNRPHLPIILTSGDAQKALAAKDLCEAQTFVNKPYELGAVVVQMRALIEDARRASEPQ